MQLICRPFIAFSIKSPPILFAFHPEVFLLENE